MVNKKKSCKIANSGLRKQSDAKDLGADAKIIIALLKKQPQKRLELCKNAGIHPSTFSRHKRQLINRNILKEGDKGFSLWTYKEVPSLWDSIVEQMNNAGGHLIKIQIERLSLGDQDHITGWYKKIYGKKTSTKGFIVFRGATKLEAVLRLHISRKYSSIVVPVSVEQGDRITCLNNTYIVKEKEKYFDGETLSYMILHVSQVN